MSAFKQTVKRITPAPLWAVGSGAYWGWHNRGRHNLARILSLRWGKNIRRIRQYQDIHKRKRCFIIGNGPSLKHTDLDKLRNEFTFGLNRVYLLFPQLGFTTTYYVAINELVLEQCADEIRQLSLPKFITWRARNWFKHDEHTLFLDTDYTCTEEFSGDITRRVFEGYTVTYMAMQVAYFMGFEEAILVGVDHNYVTPGTPNTTVVSAGDDPNHFAPGYFGKGFRWQLPDLEGSERAYRMARRAYAQANRRIVDATVGGKLTVFPKVDYNSLF